MNDCVYVDLLWYPVDLGGGGLHIRRESVWSDVGAVWLFQVAVGCLVV